MILALIFSIGILAILVSIALSFYIIKQPLGTPKMIEIYEAIRKGSKAYLRRQYKTISIISIVLAIILYIAFDYSSPNKFPLTTLAFLIGSICSLIAGYISMDISTRANARMAYAVKENLQKPLKIAFSGGFVMGLFNVALSLLGVTLLYWLYGSNPNSIVGFGFGASLSALFAQLGGGIFTKAADVGADLVGKVEKGIPEDDPRNPAVIADNVGDNVGDSAGRGADLFESMSAENIGAMIIGYSLYIIMGNIFFVIFPLLARCVGILSSLIGALFVRGQFKDPFDPLKKATIITTILSAIGFYFLIIYTIGSIYLYFASLAGLVASIAILFITDYYTSRKYKPVFNISKASVTGPATNIITGFAYSLECVALPVITISIALLASYYFGTIFAAQVNISEHLGGVYGTAVATMGMLSIAGIVLGLDGFGPIADNAGGISEMSNEIKIKNKIEHFDAVGNTTKALTKGYAMASAGLAALLLFQAYLEVAHLTIVDLIAPKVVIGLFIGILLPFAFTAFAIRAVGNAAYQMVNEVRRQFKTIKGLMQGKAKPDYAKCVDISTRAAQKEMIIPGLLPIIVPIIIGLALGKGALAAFIIGATLSGFTLAMQMNTGGAAWDNAKKFIEAGKFGGKGSEAHKASVVGDTFGDPLKDTAGPSLHVLVKLINTISLVAIPIFFLA